MKKIIINIPEEKQTKDSLLSYCFSKLKEIISVDDSIKGKISPLGDIELISGFGIISEIKEKSGEEISLEKLDFIIREFNRKEESKKIIPIKKYSKVSSSKVYIRHNIIELIQNYEK